MLRLVVLVAIAGLATGCSGKGPNYVGRWECSAGGRDSFEIKANSGAFLVTDETGTTYPASLDDKGTLVVSGVPLMGSLPLPIDSDTRELICGACGCKRYSKVGAPKTPEASVQPGGSPDVSGSWEFGSWGTLELVAKGQHVEGSQKGADFTVPVEGTVGGDGKITLRLLDPGGCVTTLRGQLRSSSELPVSIDGCNNYHADFVLKKRK